MAAKSFWCSRLAAAWAYSILFSLFLAIFAPVSAVVFLLGTVASLAAVTARCHGRRFHRVDWWNP